VPNRGGHRSGELGRIIVVAVKTHHLPHHYAELLQQLDRGRRPVVATVVDRAGQLHGYEHKRRAPAHRSLAQCAQILPYRPLELALLTPLTHDAATFKR